MYSTLGGRFAQAEARKKAKEQKEALLQIQQSQLLNAKTKAAATSGVLANPQATGNSVQLKRKTVQVPSHLARAKKLYEQSKMATKRNEATLKELNKQQEATAAQLTNDQALQLKQLADQNGISVQQLLGIIQAKRQKEQQLEPVNEEEEVVEEGYGDEQELNQAGVNNLHELFQNQTNMIAELKAANEQSSRHMQLLTQILLPPEPPVVTEQMSNEDQGLANALANRQNHYMQLLEKIQADRAEQQKHINMARLISDLSANPSVAKYLPSNKNEAGTAKKQSTDNSNKRKRGDNNTGRKQRRTTPTEDGVDDTTSAEEIDVDEAVRRILSQA